MVAVSQRTAHVSGLPVEQGAAGGDPGPFTAMGIYLGIKAAVQHKFGNDSVAGVHVAVQGTGSVGRPILTITSPREDAQARPKRTRKPLCQQAIVGRQHEVLVSPPEPSNRLRSEPDSWFAARNQTIVSMQTGIRSQHP